MRDRSSSKQYFNSLVRNAIDFFEQSIAQLNERPKDSVISFCSAIELFLKARLMVEHWSLILTKPEQASLGSFEAGNFHSVSMEEALKRLKNIVGENFGQDEMKAFGTIRDHRNRLVHFFHEKYVGEIDANTLEQVISEQCKGWFYLHQLLSKRWAEYFVDHAAAIVKLDYEMGDVRGFFSAKFEALQDEIDEERRKGVVYTSCRVCGFDACREAEFHTPLMKYACLVCHTSDVALPVECPECSERVLVWELGEGKCENCQHRIELDYLIDLFDARPRTKEDYIVPRMGYCSDCEYYTESVVAIGDEYLCLACLTFHDALYSCEFCSTAITGDTEGTYLSGCVVCEGVMGWESDD